jgi:hypothetical protein
MFRYRLHAPDGDDLFARLDHHRVGGFAEIVPVGRMEPVPEDVSSVLGPDGDGEAISEVEWEDAGAGDLDAKKPKAERDARVAPTREQSHIALLGIASRGVKADVLDLCIGEDGAFPNTGQASAKVGRRPVGSEAAGSAEKPEAMTARDGHEFAPAAPRRPSARGPSSA